LGNSSLGLWSLSLGPWSLVPWSTIARVLIHSSTHPLPHLLETPNLRQRHKPPKSSQFKFTLHHPPPSTRFPSLQSSNRSTTTVFLRYPIVVVLRIDYNSLFQSTRISQTDNYPEPEAFDRRLNPIISQPPHRGTHRRQWVSRSCSTARVIFR
jgi:hypothetical protein